MSSTPRQTSRAMRAHTPLMSERKKVLFRSRERGNARNPLPLVNSESESEHDGKSLGVAALDSSSSCDEQEPSTPSTPSQTWRETRSHTLRLLKENQDMFIKSPYTLRNFQSRFQNDHSVSTPTTPELEYKATTTPSSSRSSVSTCTLSSGCGRARRSLASLIADTESCSSSLKDLNFDTDSGTDTKENTPKKSVRKSSRLKVMTPKFASFKGILSEQRKNTPVQSITTMEIMSPTQMLKTPHSTSEVSSPPKISHNRRPVEIDESPDEERANKRPHNDSFSESAPKPKYLKLDTIIPKARLSLFNTDKLKEIISTKSFYGKINTEASHTISGTITKIAANTDSYKRSHSVHKRKRKPGQINLGVRHKIRKPKFSYRQVVKLNMHNPMNVNPLKATSSANDSANSELLLDDTDRFDKEQGTVAALLSEWNEEDAPELEYNSRNPWDEVQETVSRGAETFPCFNKSLITDSILINPNIAVPVSPTMILKAEIAEFKTENLTYLSCEMNKDELSHNKMEVDSHAAENGEPPKIGQFLPVEGGYLMVDANNDDEEPVDLDAIDRELAILDGQISTMAKENNIDPTLVLDTGNSADVSTKWSDNTTVVQVHREPEPDSPKVFPIFNKATAQSGSNTPKAGPTKTAKKMILKSGAGQYVIDAGQKKFGATQCKDCGVIYQIGDPQDEHDHLVHHNADDVLKFNGWKDEQVVGVWGEHRCVLVRGTAPESRWRRVAALLERVVHPQLGYAAALPSDRAKYAAYLYISKKQIVGCMIVEVRNKANRLLHDGDVDCCSEEEYPVKCGVSRVWTHVSHRRRGVASRLLHAARTSFLYGHVLGVDEIAFSAPTPAGGAFAAAYTERPDFLVYIQ